MTSAAWLWILTILFWASGVGLLLPLVGLPVLLLIRGRWWRRPIHPESITPPVSVIIGAYNEERHIAARIENLLASDYPGEQLEIVVASDGSTDATEDIVRQYGDQRVRLVAVPRGGKGQALNAGVAVARGEVLVFTDANTRFTPDSLRALVRPLADASVGGVVGDQRYERDATASLTADGECAYWRYDTWLKQQQAEAGSVTSATGAIYAIRRELFEPVPPDVMDDFFISTGVIARGRRLAFCREARAYEPVATRAHVEFRRKVRIATQGLQGVLARRLLLDPRRSGFYAWQLLLHKVLRRLLFVPLGGMSLAAVGLVGQGIVYRGFLGLEIAVGVLACLGWALRGTRVGRKKFLTLPYFALMTQVAMGIAVVNVVCGRRLRRWEPERHTDGKPVTA